MGTKIPLADIDLEVLTYVQFVQYQIPGSKQKQALNYL